MATTKQSFLAGQSYVAGDFLEYSGDRPPATPRPSALPSLPDCLPLNLVDFSKWSAALCLCVAEYVNPHPDIPLRKADDAIREEALRALDASMGLRGRAEIGTLQAFMWPVAGAVEFPPSESEYIRRVEALYLASSHVPHIAWTLETQKDLLLECKRLPSVAQIIQTVMRPVQQFVSVTHALQRIAKS